jgi:short-chain fatty acids transporter
MLTSPAFPQPGVDSSVLQQTGEVAGRIANRITPNPFAFAIILSVVVGLTGIALTDNGPGEMVSYWYRGFWDLLAFSMQITVILVSGHVLATSPQARSVIARASDLPRSPGQAIMMISAVAIIAAFLNWGIGLVTGAVMAVTVSARARARGIKVHFPLAAAAGYTGIMIFGSGLSSSAPLLSNTPGHFLMDQIGIVPLEQTIFTSYNFVTALIFILAVPLLLRAMHPRPERCVEVDPDLVTAYNPDSAVPITSGTTATGASFGQKLERSTTLGIATGLLGLGSVLWYLASGRASLDLNSVNFILVMSGLLIYGNPVAYASAVERAVRTAAGVILQFPFYSGIMGMMTLSGLVAVFANAMISLSTPATLPLTTMLSAAFVNIFVPSAGGQWAVQGPILVEAARALDVPIGRIIMAFAYGDQLTNMIQPFWAIPLLGITALEPKDLLGYTAIAMLVGFLIFGFGIGVLPILLG